MTGIIGQAGPVTITRMSDGKTAIEFAKSGPPFITVGSGAWRALADAIHQAAAADRAGRRK